MATGPYWFLSATAVPKKPSREMASAKESTSLNSGRDRRGIRSPSRTTKSSLMGYALAGRE